MSIVTLTQDEAPTRYAVGLSWHDPTESASIGRWKPQRQEKYYVSIETQAREKQYATTSDSRLKGYISAAAVVANSIPMPKYLLILEAGGADFEEKESCYWLVAVENGLVLPGSDIVDTGEKIANEVESLLSIYGSDTPIFAPGNESIFGAEEFDGNDFLDGLYPDSKLKVKQFSGFGKAYIAIAIILALSATKQGYELYEKARLEAKNAATLAKKQVAPDAVDVEKIRERIREIEEKQLRAKFERFVDSGPIFQAMKTYLSLPINMNGWEFDSLIFEIDGDAIEGFYEIKSRRTHGLLSGITDNDYFQEWDVAYDRLGNSALLKKQLVFSASREIEGNIGALLRHDKETEVDIINFSQRHGLRYKLHPMGLIPLHPTTGKLAREIEITSSQLGVKSGAVDLSGDNQDQLVETINKLSTSLDEYQFVKLNVEIKFPHKWKLRLVRYAKS